MGLGKVISKRPTLPVLGTVKIERTTDGWITLTGTNLDQFVTARLEQPAAGDPTSILVNLEDLARTLKACGKSEAIEIEMSGENKFLLRYAIGTQSVETPIDTLIPEEFPVIPRIKSEPIPVPDSLRESLHQAMACASTDETRYVLNGAFIDVSQKDCQQVVGTNGRQLYASNSFNLPIQRSMLIPASKFLAWKEFNNDGAWQLRIDPDQERPWFQLSTRRWRYLSRQIEGNYPNYRQVIPDPKSFKTTVEINPEHLREVIPLIAQMPCADEVNQTIGLEVLRGEIALIGRAPQAESWTRLALNHAVVTGPDVVIHLNRQFLSQGLAFGLNRIEVSDGMSPLRLSNGGRQLIVMPVRTEPAHTNNIPPKSVETKTTEDAPSSEPERTQTMVAINTSNPDPVTLTGKIDEALDTIEAMQDTLKDAIGGLKEMSGKLKQIQRDHKTNDKELQGFRNTIRSLQSLKV